MLYPLFKSCVCRHNHREAIVLTLFRLDLALEEQALFEDVVALRIVAGRVPLHFNVLHVGRVERGLGRIDSFLIHEPDVAPAKLLRRTVLLLHVHCSTPDRSEKLQLLSLSVSQSVDRLVNDLPLLLAASRSTACSHGRLFAHHKAGCARATLGLLLRWLLLVLATLRYRDRNTFTE